jgi:hypothetical protein
LQTTDTVILGFLEQQRNPTDIPGSFQRQSLKRREENLTNLTQRIELAKRRKFNLEKLILRRKI